MHAALSFPGDTLDAIGDERDDSRQVGGALAVAVFGALLAQSASFMQGLRVSLLIAAMVSLATAAAAFGLRAVR